MTAYIVRRILLAIPTLWLTGTLIFLILYATPGDPVTALVGDVVDLKVIEEIREEWGLNDPLHIRYGKWAFQMLQGNFGISYRNGEPVAELLLTKAPITVLLSAGAVVLATLVGIPLGIVCALNRNTVIDRAVTLLSLVGVSMPAFWLAYLLIYAFALGLGWLPALGYVSPTKSVVEWVRHAALPMICLSVSPLASITRMSRSCFLEVFREDYVVTAWAKGLSQRHVIYKHMLKNAIIPIITVIGMQLAILMAGVVTVELVFNIPGMGRLLISALSSRDYPVIQAIVLWIGVAFIVLNLLVDLSYGLIDPRVRYM